ncbi:MAG: DUF885 domain-containing protein [Allosphingosinicella sp.]|uniref:DUF885 domain-containing protein n=1 Tax=Allosphingosinicella sp. TaxID=2823234 RepID=UPI003930B8B9
MTRMLLLASTAALAACAAPMAEAPRAAAPAAAAATPAEANDPRLAAFFEEYDRAQLALSPLGKAYRGIIDADYGRWGDFTDADAQRSQALQQQAAADLQQRFERDRLSAADRLSYDLFLNQARRSADAFQYRRHGYIFDQMNGAQSQLPAFLINIHRVTDLATAEAYVSRLQGMGTALDQAMAEAESRAQAGILPPRWVYPLVIDASRNVIAGAPFGEGPDAPLYADLKRKIGAADIPQADKDRLIAAGRQALMTGVRPAYQRLIALMERQQAVAPTEDGVWRHPGGADFYAERLRFHTTTDMTPDQVHDLGLREVARIHGEMRQIMARVGFTGTLQDFFQHVRTDDRFFHASREDYLAEVQQVFDRVTPVLPRFFNTLPRAPLEVRPVEPFRERTAGKAFYQRPAPDGSRPGVYYVNLYNLRDMSRTELEALAYHEGVPGHHLQLAVQTELGDVPPFRQFGGVTAYSEGWGLYSEELGKDMGFYQDPYSDFGRLGMELWRAARLVTDTGIHHKRWSADQAMDYLRQNTPNPEGDIERAIRRYVVFPGQANAYTIGKLKIMELRERARTRLGDRFDIRGFHDAVLLSGPVPLDVLEANVDQWIARQGG